MKVGDRVLCLDFCGGRTDTWTIGVVEDPTPGPTGAITIRVQGVDYPSLHVDSKPGFRVGRSKYAELPKDATEDQIRALAGILGAKKLNL